MARRVGPLSSTISSSASSSSHRRRVVGEGINRSTSGCFPISVQQQQSSGTLPALTPTSMFPLALFASSVVETHGGSLSSSSMLSRSSGAAALADWEKQFAATEGTTHDTILSSSAHRGVEGEMITAPLVLVAETDGPPLCLYIITWVTSHLSLWAQERDADGTGGAAAAARVQQRQKEWMDELNHIAGWVERWNRYLSDCDRNGGRTGENGAQVGVGKAGGGGGGGMVAMMADDGKHVWLQSKLSSALCALCIHIIQQEQRHHDYHDSDSTPSITTAPLHAAICRFMKRTITRPDDTVGSLGCQLVLRYLLRQYNGTTTTHNSSVFMNRPQTTTTTTVDLLTALNDVWGYKIGGHVRQHPRDGDYLSVVAPFIAEYYRKKEESIKRHEDSTSNASNNTSSSSSTPHTSSTTTDIIATGDDSAEKRSVLSQWMDSALQRVRQHELQTLRSYALVASYFAATSMENIPECSSDGHLDPLEAHVEHVSVELVWRTLIATLVRAPSMTPSPSSSSSSLLDHHGIGGAALYTTQRKHFLDAIMSLRLATYRSFATTTDLVHQQLPSVATAAPVATSLNMEREMQSIHKLLRTASTLPLLLSASPAGGGSRSGSKHPIPATTSSPAELRSILDARDLLHSQYNNSSSTVAALSSDMLDLRLYINGTALMMCGHRTEAAADWNAAVHTEIAAIVEDVIATLSSRKADQAVVPSHHQGSQDDDVNDSDTDDFMDSFDGEGSSSASLPSSSPASPSTTQSTSTTIHHRHHHRESILKRCHEGLRLAMKSYLRRQDHDAIIAVYERYPSMGACWEIVRSYTVKNVPRRAVAVGHDLIVAMEESGIANKRGLPPQMAKLLADCVEWCGREDMRELMKQRDDADDSNNNRATNQSSTSSMIEVELRNLLLQTREHHPTATWDGKHPSTARRASSLRVSFVTLLKEFPLRHIPNAILWERYMQGAVTEASVSTNKGFKVSSPTLQPAAAILEHANIVLHVAHSTPNTVQLEVLGLTSKCISLVCLTFLNNLHWCAAVDRQRQPTSTIDQGEERDDTTDLVTSSSTVAAWYTTMLATFQTLDAAFPRMCVWTCVLQWLMLHSGEPHIAATVLERLYGVVESGTTISTTAIASEPLRTMDDSAMLALLDTLSEAVLRGVKRYVEENVAMQLDTATQGQHASLLQLMETSLRQKDGVKSRNIAVVMVSSDAARSPSSAAEVSHPLQEQEEPQGEERLQPWVCVYCSHRCSPSAASCPVCSSLRLHLWRCDSCHGFTPSTIPSNCQVCGEANHNQLAACSSSSSSSTHSSGTAHRHHSIGSSGASHHGHAVPSIVPLRPWTCGLCRTKNNAHHIFFCRGCKAPSRVALQQRRSMEPFACTECGSMQTAGMLRPWCDHCGTLHPKAAAGAADPPSLPYDERQESVVEDDLSTSTIAYPSIPTLLSERADQDVAPTRPSGVGSSSSSSTSSPASLWSCQQCAQWNPWTIFHCTDCAAPKPVIAAHRLETSWDRWGCASCDGWNAMWRTTCGHCHAVHPPMVMIPEATAESASSGSSSVVEYDSTLGDDDGITQERENIKARSDYASLCDECGTPTIEGIPFCLHCGAKPSSSPSLQHNSGRAPLLWVCLREGCLHINLHSGRVLDQLQSQPSRDGGSSSSSLPLRCEVCGVAKGLTTTLAVHTNIFSFNPLEFQRQQEQAEQQRRQQEAAAAAANTNQATPIESDWVAPPPPLHPMAVDVYHPLVQGGNNNSQYCKQCNEPMPPWNLLRLCGACLTSSWSPTHQQETAAMVLWLHLGAAETFLKDCHPSNDDGTLQQQSNNSSFSSGSLITLLEVCVAALRRAQEAHLPWRGRDVWNMRCTESSRIPVHEPEGLTHSGLQRVSRLISAITNVASGERQRRRERASIGWQTTRTADANSLELVDAFATQRRWLRLGVQLVELANTTTDMDELSFDVVSELAKLIHMLDVVEEGQEHVVATDSSSDNPRTAITAAAFVPNTRITTITDDTVNAWRIDYLAEQKMPIGILVGSNRCPNCLKLRGGVLSSSSSVVSCDCRKDVRSADNNSSSVTGATFQGEGADTPPPLSSDASSPSASGRGVVAAAWTPYSTKVKPPLAALNVYDKNDVQMQQQHTIRRVVKPHL